ncbi:hypothetical protein [Novosphingobium sp.]|uniref:hypothetical protein n=1 Tax=Novosphingobium sp. TaxID=1874826 RepID=UPI00286AD9A4|nr:hypothetical protein [Novosphingobium sp.]
MPSRTLSAALALAAACAAPAAQAASADFTCRNAQAEVTCTAQKCAVDTTAFTPMSVSLTGSQLEVCAYSACQSGTVDLRRARGDLLVVHARTGGAGGAALVSYDRKQRIATLLWGNYALPMSCAAD